MKKIFTITLAVLGIMVLATPVLAATTILLTPASIEITEEENFTLMVAVNPQGIKNYTVKVGLEYPADLLEVKSFTFGSDWMALSQAGYDLVDNTNGVLVKTAGFPGGISEPVTFGIVSFSAKKTGEGIIKIGGDSIVLDGANHNVLSAPLAQTLVTIAAPVPPKEEVVPPVRPLFDILIEPVAKELRKWPLIPTFGAIGVLILIIVVYIIYRKRKRKIVQ